MAERFREFSFLYRLDNGDDPYEADMRVVFDHRGRSYRRILSRVKSGVYADVPMEGDAKLYERLLMKEKRIMADFDDMNRPGRPILKEITPAVDVQCPDCTGDGEAEDKHGNWRTCKRCKGNGYVVD